MSPVRSPSRDLLYKRLPHIVRLTASCVHAPYRITAELWCHSRGMVRTSGSPTGIPGPGDGPGVTAVASPAVRGDSAGCTPIQSDEPRSPRHGRMNIERKPPASEPKVLCTVRPATVDPVEDAGIRRRSRPGRCVSGSRRAVGRSPHSRRPDFTTRCSGRQFDTTISLARRR